MLDERLWAEVKVGGEHLQLGGFHSADKRKGLGFSLAKDIDVDGLRPVVKKSIAAYSK